MVGTARHGIERDVVAAGRVEPSLLIGHDRLLRVTRGTTDMNVVGGVERHQSGVVSAPRAFDLPVEARAPDLTVADEDYRETGAHDLVHERPSVPSTPAPSHALQA